ncbi:protein NETWORKED 1B-like [Nicotiana tomentosiformis]|uniref:protein NETWORKED 1B-like n=1 Tax=Nicotiana tomentosiformis TaxID=4098 RepID=UPI00388C93AA
MMLHEAPPRTEDIPERDSGGIPELLEIKDAPHRSQRMGDMSERALESLRTEENALSDSFGAAAIEDSPTFPAFSAGVIREAQALGGLDLDKPHDGEDPFRDLFTGIEDVASTGDESDLFHGVRQATTVHRETCSRSQNELRRYEADLQRVTNERNSLTLLLGQREEEIKDLRAELVKAHRDQTDLSEQVMILLKAYGLDTRTMAKFSVSQLQQKIEMIGKVSLGGRRDKSGVFAVERRHGEARRINELETWLAFILAKAESDAEKAKDDADALVAVYRADAEAAQVQAREAAEIADTRVHCVAELAKCRSRRETLEEIHARGFDLAEEIKRAKELKADAEALVSDDGDDGNDDDDGSLGDNVVMRKPPLGGEEVPKPTKDNKRRRASPPETPKPKKSSLESRRLISSFCLPMLRHFIEKRPPNTGLSWPDVRLISKSLCELTRAHRDQTELIELKAELVKQLREEAKMKEAETLGWKQSMDHLASEKDAVRDQLSSVERQLQSVKVENLARAHKVEELETRLAAELARATSEAEALVASYRADAEVANTRAKEISDAAEVRLSRVTEHTRR